MGKESLTKVFHVNLEKFKNIFLKEHRWDNSFSHCSNRGSQRLNFLIFNNKQSLTQRTLY